jgi:hypothetical protein
MKRLYLHVGYPKTATTSIQKTLQTNAHLLKEMDYLYPRKSDNRVLSPYFLGDKMAKSHLLIKSGVSKERIHKDMNEIITEIHRSNSKNIILSAEKMVGFSEETLLTLKNFIETTLHIQKIIVLVSVREVVARTTSSIQQKAKGGYNYKIKYQNIFNTKLNNFINIFGKENLNVYKFEDACKHHLGPVGYFLTQIGLSEKQIDRFTIEHANEGVSDKAVDLLQFINQHIPLIQNGRLAKERVHRDTTVLYKIRGNKFILPQDIQQQLFESSQEDREWLYDNFAISYETFKPKEPFTIIYDEDYYNDIIMVYPNLSPILQKVVYKYIEDKKELVDDSVSQDTLEKLMIWIDQFDKEKPNSSTMKLVKLFENNTVPKDVHIYREIALMAEDEEQIEMALYFMKKAKALRPNGTKILQKIEEYEKKLVENEIK